MPHRVEDVARDALAACDCSAGHLLASQWVVARYQQLATRVRLRHLRRVGELRVPGQVTAGLANFTLGSDLITGDATAQAAWTSDMIGRHIRGKVVWHEIVNVTSGVLKIASPYTESSASASSYTIVQQWIPLDPLATFIGRQFIYAERRIAFDLRQREELDKAYPSRQAVGRGPDIVAEAPALPDGTRRVEIYPYQQDPLTLKYIWWPNVGEMQPQDALPPQLQKYALKEGVLIDIYRYKMAQAADKGEIEKAAFWRNEMRTQETKWEVYIRELMQSDNQFDDLTFILGVPGIGMSDSDIRTAQDQVLSMWPR
ncbi:hypothetical protein [Nitrospira sp. BLG_1]|uniref:hypothetical protein n=1 Tax=Nitrospira sp. BLG_1 TaxID=3395883 RepID=UPI0039BD887E